MIYTLRLNRKNKVRKVLDIFDHLVPFSLLTEKERDVLAEYINEYYSLIENLDEKKIPAILKKYSFTTAVANKLDISKYAVSNNATKLRAKGLLDGNSLSENTLALFNAVDDEIIFKFKYKD